MTELPQERLLVGEMAIASAEACFEWTRTYLKERKAFGASLLDKQTLQHRLATIKTEVRGVMVCVLCVAYCVQHTECK
jgi:long-chain-acyl-CoA dehydrogenase